jgi:tripartite-type tricarboxylate transporter receptor subunit TctC
MKHLLFFLSLLVAVNVAAQQFDPQRNTVTVVSPTAPGGPTDSSARIFSDYLNRKGITSVVANKTGGAGTIGPSYLAQRTGDNYTVAVLPSSTFFLPLTGTTPLPYNENTFVPVGSFGTALPALALSTQIKSETMNQFLDEYKQNSQRINFGTFNGLAEFWIAQIVESTNIKPNIVLYRSSAQLLTDVTSNNVQVGLLDLNSARPMVEAGKIKVITGSQLPANIRYWWGLYAAPGASREAVEWYANQLAAMHNDPESQIALRRALNNPRGMSLTDYEQFHQSEINGMRRLIGGAKR